MVKKPDYRVTFRRDTYDRLQELAGAAGTSVAEVVVGLVEPATPGAPPTAMPPDTPEGSVMTECIDCKLKDRDISDRDRDLVSRDAKIQELTQSLEGERKTHDRLGPLLVHAKDGSCANCNADLREHNEAVIKGALEKIDPKVLHDLALAGGVIPQTIKVTIPD